MYMHTLYLYYIYCRVTAYSTEAKSCHGIYALYTMYTYYVVVCVGYEIMLRFCNTEDDDPGSGVENETQLLSPESPGSEAVCETATHPVDATTLFFVLNNDVLPDYEHNLTYTVSKTNLHC